MNTVFSVFKGSGGGGGGAGSNVDAKSTTKALANSKSLLATTALKENSSYENLRHIRELESSINAFVVNVDDGDDDDDTNSSSSGSQHTTIRMVGGGKRCITPLTVVGNGMDVGSKWDSMGVSVIAAAPNGSDEVDFVVRSPVKVVPMDCDVSTSVSCVFKLSENPVIESVATPSSGDYTESASVPSSACFSSDGDISNSCNTAETADSEQYAQCPIEKASISHEKSRSSSNQHTNHHVTSSSGDLTHAPIIASNSRGHSESNLSASKSTNRFQKRLSLSGFPNNSMPSVHGRPSTAGGALCGGGGGSSGAATGTGGEVKRTRLSTHQRNLSLDFR